MNAIAVKLFAAFFVIGSLIGLFTWQNSTIKTLRAQAVVAVSDIASQKAKVIASETARATEREQCNNDFAGEDARHKIELEAARKAATARASLTTACAFDGGPKSVNKALKANSGERP